MSIREKCQSIVRNLQQQYLLEYPIKLSYLIKNLNCNSTNIQIYERTDLPKDICGITMILENDRGIIININKNQIRTRKRFTVAHELGHILLGHCKEDVPMFDTEDTLGHGSLTYERQANVFAAELLMPARVVKSYCYKQHMDTSDDVANYFQVSKQAAQIRLEELNLI